MVWCYPPFINQRVRGSEGQRVRGSEGQRVMHHHHSTILWNQQHYGYYFACSCAAAFHKNVLGQVDQGGGSGGWGCACFWDHWSAIACAHQLPTCAQCWTLQMFINMSACPPKADDVTFWPFMQAAHCQWLWPSSFVNNNKIIMDGQSI